MHKIFFVLLCFVSMKSFSQIKIGIEGGYNAATFSQFGETPDGDNGISISSLSTFSAGIVSEIPLSKKIFLQPALLYFGSGSNADDQSIIPGGEYYSHTLIQVYYLRLPVDVVYKVRLAKHFNFLAGAGLYAAKGLSGTAKGSGGGTNPNSGTFTYTFNNKVDFSNDLSGSGETNAVIKTFDVGFNVLAGLQYKGFLLKATYSQGFSEIYSCSDYNYKNASFELSLAYLFS